MQWLMSANLPFATPARLEWSNYLDDRSLPGMPWSSSRAALDIAAFCLFFDGGGDRANDRAWIPGNAQSVRILVVSRQFSTFERDLPSQAFAAELGFVNGFAAQRP